MVTAALVDETLPLDNASQNVADDSVKTVNVNIFTKERSNLPKIRFGGDVLRLHRVSTFRFVQNCSFVCSGR